MSVKILGKIDVFGEVKPSDVLVTRVGGLIHFKTVIDVKKDHARVLQTELGYHPLGYGFYWGSEYATYKDSWTCSASCD